MQKIALLEKFGFTDLSWKTITVFLSLSTYVWFTSACPSGFILNSEAKKCYSLIQIKDTYDRQFIGCARLNAGAHLAAPLSSDEDRFIRSMIQASSERDNCRETYDSGTKWFDSYYIAGKRLDSSACSEFVWQLSYGTFEEKTYRNFYEGEPNCAGKIESCIHYLVNFQWNDVPCDTKFCAVCEYRLPAVTTTLAITSTTEKIAERSIVNSALIAKPTYTCITLLLLHIIGLYYFKQI